MKKIGFIILAVVLALGALGAGYAYWSQTLTVSGSVTTGTLEVGMQPGTIPAPQPDAGGATYYMNHAGLLVESGWWDTIEAGILHAYPGYSVTSELLVKNLGTVPAKVLKVNFTPTGDFVTEMGIMTIGDWSIRAPNSISTINGSGITGSSGLEGLAGQTLVLQPGDTATIDIAVTFPTTMDNTTMNQVGGFTVTVNMGQFNQ